jgi:outer membrane murein-binding lipoprotein Lpp
LALEIVVMLSMKTKWPKWLFYLTLLFWFLLLNVGYVNDSKKAQLSYNTQQLQTAMREYNEFVSTISGVTQDNIKTSFVSVPIQLQDCKNNFLGIKSCDSVNQLSQQEIYEPTDELDASARKKIDTLGSKITSLVAEADKTHNDVENFSQISDIIMNIMKPIVSVFVLISCLFVILSKRYQDDTQKWAFGSLGTVLGFWLK